MLKILSWWFSFFLPFAGLQSCGTEYRDISTENGRNAVIEKAENFLTQGQCNDAIDTLQPLYDSIYRNHKTRMVYASAYACRGGFNFAALIATLRDASGNDIWSLLIASNYSDSRTNGKTTAFIDSAGIIRTTSTQGSDTPNYWNALYRPADANTYMIFIQAMLIASILSPPVMGDANSVNGNQRRDILVATDPNDTEKCRVQVALATIRNCLTVVSTGTAIDRMTTAIDAVCAVGGVTCATNMNPDGCAASDRLAGETIITAIESIWVGP